jgi:NAD-dependent dihydropyrimidine dehydrogenase PreA subunit
MFENCYLSALNSGFAKLYYSHNCHIYHCITAVMLYLPLKSTGELVSLNINRYKCGYCGACVGVCPKGALELVETWVEVDESTCIACGVCDRVCPVGAIEVIK